MATLPIWKWLLLLLYPFAVGIGQILFKMASNRMGPGQPLVQYIFEPFLLAAMTLYFALALFWVYIIKFLPISVAYPFVALSFIFTPLLAWMLLNEQLSGRYIFGILLICAGVIVTQGATYAK